MGKRGEALQHHDLASRHSEALRTCGAVHCRLMACRYLGDQSTACGPGMSFAGGLCGDAWQVQLKDEVLQGGQHRSSSHGHAATS